MIEAQTQAPYVPSDDPSKRRTAVRLTRELWLKLGRLALERDLSLNDVFLIGMTDWFNRQPEAREWGLLPTAAPTKKGRPFKDDEADEADAEEPAKPVPTPKRSPKKQGQALDARQRRVQGCRIG